MVVNIYHFTGNNNSMSKSLELLNASPLTVVPTQGISLMGGEIILDYTNIAWNRANYLYLSGFERYYFIKNVVLDIGKKVYLNTQVDPLYTFATNIKLSPATCLRAEKFKAPTNYSDSKLPIIPNQNEPHSTVFLESPFNVSADYSYIVGVLCKSEGGE